jgi:hypothetical protein
MSKLRMLAANRTDRMSREEMNVEPRKSYIESRVEEYSNL